MAENKTFKLTIEDRVAICMTDLLPKQGSYLTDRIRESIIVKSQPSLQEMRNLGFQQGKDKDKAGWKSEDAEKIPIKEIEFIDLEYEHLKLCLLELEKPRQPDYPHGRLQAIHKHLYELIVEPSSAKTKGLLTAKDNGEGDTQTPPKELANFNST